MPQQNIVLLMGHLARDPEPIVSKNGMQILNFCIVVSSGKGENKKASFIDCVAFGNSVDFFMMNKPEKGDLVQIEGGIEQDRWESESGEKRSKLKVVCNRLHFLRHKLQKEIEDKLDNLEVDISSIELPEDDIPF